MLREGGLWLRQCALLNERRGILLDYHMYRQLLSRNPQLLKPNFLFAALFVFRAFLSSFLFPSLSALCFPTLSLATISLARITQAEARPGETPAPLHFFSFTP